MNKKKYSKKGDYHKLSLLILHGRAGLDCDSIIYNLYLLSLYIYCDMKGIEITCLILPKHLHPSGLRH